MTLTFGSPCLFDRSAFWRASLQLNVRSLGGTSCAAAVIDRIHTASGPASTTTSARAEPRRSVPMRRKRIAIYGGTDLPDRAVRLVHHLVQAILAKKQS